MPEPGEGRAIGDGWAKGTMDVEEEEEAEATQCPEQARTPSFFLFLTNGLVHPNSRRALRGALVQLLFGWCGARACWSRVPALQPSDVISEIPAWMQNKHP